jgi:enamine deaminase RidA (YjgF/YER057c/UK114 family)
MNRRRVSSASPFEHRYGFRRAIRIGDRIEVAGTAPIPQDGSDPPPDAHGQMLLCCEIAIAAIEELGGASADVVRTRMFIVDAAESDDIGRAHGVAFAGHPPVSTMVVVAGLLDPRWKVELEVEAVVD